MKISTILVPTDFSACSEQALDYAVELASKLDARVHLLTVIGIPAYGLPELGIGVTAPMIDSLVSDGQGEVDRLARERKLGTQALVRTGDAREVILQTAEELKADLIVMGTHGRRGVSRALLGSVAEMIVRRSPTPVLTVRGKK
ncbi:MAG TPA: universal stress protein [Polyangiaceae bacterium]|nr:universal stress protein [Polyangiaceae bacterium]